MSHQQSKDIFYEILSDTPLPNEDKWDIRPLQNADLRNERGWTEVLYRTRASLVLE